MVDIEHAFEMVAFVLDDACQKSGNLLFVLFHVFVLIAETYMLYASYILA